MSDAQLFKDLTAILLARRINTSQVRLNVAKGIKDNGSSYAFDVFSEFSDVFASMERTFVKSTDKTLTDEKRAQIYNALEAVCAARDFLVLIRMVRPSAKSTFFDEDTAFLTRKDGRVSKKEQEFRDFVTESFLFDAKDANASVMAFKNEIKDSQQFPTPDGYLQYILENELEQRVVLEDFLLEKKNKSFFVETLAKYDDVITNDLIALFRYDCGTLSLSIEELKEITEDYSKAKKLRDTAFMFTLAPNLAGQISLDEMKEKQALERVLDTLCAEPDHTFELVAQNAATARCFTYSPNFHRYIPTTSSTLHTRAREKHNIR